MSIGKCIHSNPSILAYKISKVRFKHENKATAFVTLHTSIYVLHFTYIYIYIHIYIYTYIHTYIYI